MVDRVRRAWRQLDTVLETRSQTTLERLETVLHVAYGTNSLPEVPLAKSVY